MTTKNILLCCAACLLLGSILGGLTVDKIKECPEPSANHNPDSIITSLRMDNDRLIHDRNLAVRSLASLQEQADMAKKAIPTSKTSYHAYKKAARDAGLDALRDSLGQVASD